MLDTLRRTAGSAGPYKRAVALNLGVQLLLGALFILVYFLLVSLLAPQGASYAGVTLYALVIAACIAAYFGAGVWYYGCSLQTGYDTVAGLRIRLADHLRRLPLSFFRKNDASSLSGRFLHDMGDAESVFSVFIHEILASFLVILLFAAMLCVADPVLGAILVGASLLSLPVILASAKSWGNSMEKYIALRTRTDSTLLEYLSGIRELKATGLTGGRFRPWKEADADMRGFGLEIETRLGVISQLYIGIIDLAFVIAMLAGAALVHSGALAVTTFLFFMLVSGRYFEPLQNIGIFLAECRYAYESLKRIAGVLNEPPLPILGGYARPGGHAVAFTNVSFAYGSKTILDGVSFTLEEGTVTALVGESGSGKTTTANLLLRFWDVRDGSICVGGTDIRSFPPEKLYELYSVVFQDVYLFDDTVMNNIRMARPEASEEEVTEAARKACCHDFIMQLEDGYATRVGEKGSRLSGGERQRIAIARALLKNAPILILDEATASVDPENELLIQQGLSNLVRGKTVLVIAHRLSTVKDAAQILVLKDGRVAERGTHAFLREQSGIYENLWRHQEMLKSWTVEA